MSSSIYHQKCFPDDISSDSSAGAGAGGRGRGGGRTASDLFGWSMAVLGGLAFMIGSILMLQRLKCSCCHAKFPLTDPCRRTWSPVAVVTDPSDTSPPDHPAVAAAKGIWACICNKQPTPKIDPAKRKTWDSDDPNEKKQDAKGKGDVQNVEIKRNIAAIETTVGCEECKCSKTQTKPE